jgi:predicted MFS family arabinose efflux permease
MISASETPAWGAVISMMLGVFGLVTAEFLPASPLTPIARDLGVTEGLAGQAVTATAAVALVSSLLVATVTRGLDRRFVPFSGNVRFPLFPGIFPDYAAPIVRKRP